MSFSYNLYRQSPGWGTSQFAFDTPPAPSFQPQPSWGGWDFYRAHAGPSPDPLAMYYDKGPVDLNAYHDDDDRSLFNSAWNRVRDHNYSNYQSSPGGVGVHEARHWHNRAYGGLGELNHMLPPEIGHAASYEAYRKWIHHHRSMYEPLSADFDRQREALIGLAVAETTMLLQYTTRGNDPYTRRAAAEAAAATASHIFFWSRDHDDYDLESRGRSSSSYGAGSSFGDPYAHDRDVMYSRQRPRSRSPYHYPLDERSPVSPISMMHNSSYGSSYDNSQGSYSGIGLGALVAVGGLVQLKNIGDVPMQEKWPYIVQIIVYGLYAVNSVVAFFGASCRNLSIIKSYAVILAVHLVFSIASGGYSLYHYFKDSPQVVEDCINGAIDHLKIEACKQGEDVVKGVMVGVFIFIWLVELWGVFIVREYGYQLEEEIALRAKGGPW
ncbi:hypothetical protein D9757_004349 [Collybiopsis confluens]|uniref:Uncharacterized protein n=1 Tax=Collybiopsis confluens TaxID=2823264 RepID=A0A8H5HU34_9AGAR|nr:hypothetical protein D9757_004349 [Collybiopsis confluens]